MRPDPLTSRQWTCHWSHITRRTADGREVRMPVWICEYPYRTILASPCTDCEGHASAAGRRIAAAALEPLPADIFVH